MKEPLGHRVNPSNWRKRPLGPLRRTPVCECFRFVFKQVKLSEDDRRAFEESDGEQS